MVPPRLRGCGPEVGMARAGAMDAKAAGLSTDVHGTLAPAASAHGMSPLICDCHSSKSSEL